MKKKETEKKPIKKIKLTLSMHVCQYMCVCVNACLKQYNIKFSFIINI